VVAPETCGIGGDLFALVHRPGWEKPRALNASGRSGSNALADLNRGSVPIPRDHPLCVTVPGCVDGWAELSSELGALSLHDCLSPAIAHAEEGFEVSTEQAGAFQAEAAVYSSAAAVRDFYPDGKPVARGDMVKRPALATTLRAIAGGGRDAFYRGEPAEEIVEELGGIITYDDLAQNHADWVSPISCKVGGIDAWTVPPNSVGYLGLATLAVFEMLEPPADPDDPDWWHLLIEAFRSVAWERNDLVADPDLAPLPTNLLLDRERLARAAATVDKATTGMWPGGLGSHSSTAYMCVVDAEGMAVSIIQSNYHGTGSAFGAARSGFLLQNRGSGFSLTPGHPNCLGPGRRPLHTLSPTLWTRGQEAAWVLGTRGGSVQPQIVAQVAARTILSAQTPMEAQGAPRWTMGEFGPFSTARFQVEPGVSVATLEDLRGRGHVIEVMTGRQPDWGPVSIIEVTGATRSTSRDPRVDTTSAVVF
jgi:gamma-glutamyltranspeptidase/glutathione hydrolase